MCKPRIKDLLRFEIQRTSIDVRRTTRTDVPHAIEKIWADLNFSTGANCLLKLFDICRVGLRDEFSTSSSCSGEKEFTVSARSRV